MTAKNTNRNLELIHGVRNSLIHSKKPVIVAAAKTPQYSIPPMTLRNHLLTNTNQNSQNLD
ncbi:hypothetical protein H5410_023350 [Solanum commersonii]|uniref:Uncharacterized protein n=1 Tax=Solanum commersonii TaxID=4109 RepID=A0A9J5ZI07_SOLCO|nr:hypothetical protein H5410_023350 [Solanum commersonii]